MLKFCFKRAINESDRRQCPESSAEDGLGALSGRSDSYFSKAKAKTLEAKLALGTKIAAAVFIVLSILLLIVK